MATLTKECSPTVAGSDSQLIDASVPFSLSKFLRSAFRRFLEMNLRTEDALPSAQQPMNSVLLSCLYTSNRQNYPLVNASGLLSLGSMEFKACWGLNFLAVLRYNLIPVSWDTAQSLAHYGYSHQLESHLHISAIPILSIGLLVTLHSFQTQQHKSWTTCAIAPQEAGHTS